MLCTDGQAVARPAEALVLNPILTIEDAAGRRHRPRILATRLKEEGVRFGPRRYEITRPASA